MVARDLLGRYLIRRLSSRRILIGKIVEVEAYRASDDPASHAFRGLTRRNSVMFGPPGHLYVYFTYGMHFCANIVTERNGKAGAVLLRGIQPFEGIQWMRKNRMGHSDENLTNGPAKICESFRLGRKQNGLDLMLDDLYLTWGAPTQRQMVGRSGRIGLRNGSQKQWRWYVKENRWVSRTPRQRSRS